MILNSCLTSGSLMPIEESGFLLFTCGKREVSMVLVWLNIMIIVVTVTHKL